MFNKYNDLFVFSNDIGSHVISLYQKKHEFIKEKISKRLL